MSDRLDARMSDDELLDSVHRLGRPTELMEPPADLWYRISAEVEAAPPSVRSAVDKPAVVVPLRRRRVPLIGLAAAAVVAIAAVAGVLVLRDDTSVESVASAVLDPLVDDIAVASSSLEEVDGVFVVEIDADIVPPDGAFHELWLIDTAVTEPISLGTYEGPGRYEVPAGIAPSAYPIVDISVEEFDGDDSHSGDSVLRGVLDL